ncbi:cyclin-G-associated kinase-like [Panonychus citri]|uniref:cyclin-G-associated kinase-like n=1 Tax=Panonychus citri TaxID=50023 RepID=UPI002307A1C2|nr:cyclin-G-associated kinase-like [Panonychus citri]
MSDYLRSAFSNFSSNWGNTANDDGSHRNDIGNEFVGQTINLKGHRLKVERVVAEGGFGFVFSVRDLQSQERYALKRLIASGKEAQKEIENEIEVLTRLQPHPHIMKFISWGLINPNIYLILSEYCGRGCLKDLTLPLDNTPQLNKILYQTALALEQMHQLNITHRDLKIENILFDNSGYVKLCDFGSATTNCYQPDHGWTPIQRSLLEDEMTRHTTPMYRPPETLDTYLNYPINTAMDIWAFGCLTYCIKFGRHPFEDSAKLRIINCKYTISPNIPDSDIHLQIIRDCLKVDPRERVAIDDIISLLNKNFVDLDSPCVRSPQSTPTNQPSPSHQPSNQQTAPPHPGSAQPTFGLSGFTRYLKDTSSKVMQTVQQSIANGQLRKGETNTPGEGQPYNRRENNPTTLGDNAQFNRREGSRPVSSNDERILNRESVNRHSDGSYRSRDPNNPIIDSRRDSDGSKCNRANENTTTTSNRDSIPIGADEVFAHKEASAVGDLLNLSLDESDRCPSDNISKNNSNRNSNNYNNGNNQHSLNDSLFTTTTTTTTTGLDGSSTSDGHIDDVNPSTSTGTFDLLIDPSTSSNGVNENLSGVGGANSAFDLLNDIFNSTDKSTSQNQSQQQQQHHQTNSISPTHLPKPDLLFPSPTATSSNNNNNNPNLINAFPGLHRNTSTPNLTQLDPLSELGSFVNNPSNLTTSSSTSSTNQKLNQSTNQGSGGTGTGIPRVSSCSTFQPFHNSATNNGSNASGNFTGSVNNQGYKPDYNRAYFSESSHASNSATGPRVTGFEFEDLLSDFPKQHKNEPQNKSLAAMKKQEMIREGISPIEIKVNEWKENKKKNIRALLSSLHTVVWDDCSWQQAGLQQLMSHNDVKKMYRKACLAVHPDKLVGSEHEQLAKLIFVELNNAWTEFEKQEILKPL